MFLFASADLEDCLYFWGQPDNLVNWCTLLAGETARWGQTIKTEQGTS